MPKLDPKDFRVLPGHRVNLRKWPTLVRPAYDSKDHYHQVLESHIQELSSLQTLLFASNAHAILLVFQAMDAAGKDGMIKHVMSGVNPQGCQVYSFKHPGPEELEHDFLWRATRLLPERGRIGIFNRSYYEEVLIVRVHPEILEGEHIPHELLDQASIWDQRFRSIVDFERHLHRNGTRIVKFFLHISKEEQRKRLLDRADDADKNWKLSADDIAERKYWKDYMRAYEAALEATSTPHAPWYVVPADDKLNARLIVSEVILDLLRRLKMSFPKLDSARRRELKNIRAQLMQK
jgi:PPK2 family polyphosphate:nucleotide phosphotransferase